MPERILEFSAIRERLHKLSARRRSRLPRRGELTPSFDPDEVWSRLELTREAHDAMARDLRRHWEPWVTRRSRSRWRRRAGYSGGAELFKVGERLSVTRSLKAFLENRKLDLPRLYRFSESLPEHRKLEQDLLDSLEADGTVRDSASSALSSIRGKKRSAAKRIQERIQSYISGRSRDLLSDPIFTVRDGRYVLPLKAENRGKIRGIVHDSSSSGQTIYIEPEDVLQAGNALREIEAAERDEIPEAADRVERAGWRGSG